MLRYLKVTKNIIKKKAIISSYRKNRFIASDKKIVSFTFDDAEKSAFTAGSEMYSKYNVNATFYISLSFLEGQQENRDLYSIQDLKKCVLEGHELGCHTYGHLSFSGVKDQNLVLKDLLRNQSVLNLIGIDQPMRNFSYPRGLQTMLNRKITKRQYQTSRGIEHGINLGKTDLNNLKSIKLYEHLHSLEAIYTLLYEFKRMGGWLIFYTHDVKEGYSQYGCSPSYLEAVLKKCLDLGFDINTVDAATDELGSLK
jgi:peptidoglycan/xylan/chitin deacetylase (PgdA/CDA1 family)